MRRKLSDAFGPTFRQMKGRAGKYTLLVETFDPLTYVSNKVATVTGCTVTRADVFNSPVARRRHVSVTFQMSGAS